jgi:hypothetical protein
MADWSADVIASIFSGEKEAWAKSFIAPLADLQLRETPFRCGGEPAFFSGSR